MADAVGAAASGLPAPRAFAHTPYADGVRPFSIALRPLDAAEWLAPDRRLGRDLAEKERILAREGRAAFRAEAGTGAAQAEALSRVIDHLSGRFPSVWRASDEAVTVTTNGFSRRFRLADHAADPLDLAGRLVQDDLMLLRRGPEGHRLVAASLCFPSSWSLADKFGRGLGAIHAGVPGYPGRMADRVQRIFDHLRPDAPVVRFNWSIYGDGALRHSLEKAAPGYARRRARLSARDGFVRCERQTLVRLARSGDVLFTIKVEVDPLARLAAHPEGARLAASLAARLAGLDGDELAYKGLVASRDRLVRDLDSIAAGQRP